MALSRELVERYFGPVTQMDGTFTGSKYKAPRRIKAVRLHCRKCGCQFQRLSVPEYVLQVACKLEHQKLYYDAVKSQGNA